MPAGLFGKLPAKRDFIAAHTPRRFLDAYEPWLQAALATARAQLGDSFVEIYNQAPMWRYWLGAGLTGEATAGVWMPSVDAMGRRFPLTLFSCETTAPPAPPEVDANDVWFNRAETLLLGALDEGRSFEALSEAAAAMPDPIAAAQDVGRLDDGTLLSRGEDGFALAFARMRRSGGRLFDGASFWWTAGGPDYPSATLSCAGWPHPTRLQQMMTGDFEERG